MLLENEITHCPIPSSIKSIILIFYMHVTVAKVSSSIISCSISNRTWMKKLKIYNKMIPLLDVMLFINLITFAQDPTKLNDI